MKHFVLYLDDKHYFEFQSFKDIGHLLRLEDAQIIFYNDKDQLIVGEDCLFDLLNECIVVLDRALQNKARLDVSITENIGYVWNKALHGEEGLKYNGHLWVGLRNAVWGCPGNIQPNLETWIYNDIEGNIIIEITENYFWHHLESIKGKNYVTYAEFMAQYRPYFISQIPPKIAQEWLAQMQELRAIIRENDRLHENE